MKILIIEDDPGIRQIMSEILGSSSFECIAFEEGKGALDYLKKNLNFDFLIFLDLVMPGMNGWEFLNEIASLRTQVNIKTVVVTGLQSTRRGTLDNQVDQVLEKPFRIEGLLQCIDRFALEFKNSH